jgi:hypothetical protein
MENKAVKTSESRLQTETKDNKKEEQLSTKPKDKKKEKKLSTKPKRKWLQCLFCHVSRLFHAFII